MQGTKHRQNELKQWLIQTCPAFTRTLLTLLAVSSVKDLKHVLYSNNDNNKIPIVPQS